MLYTFFRDVAKSSSRAGCFIITAAIAAHPELLQDHAALFCGLLTTLCALGWDEEI